MSDLEKAMAGDKEAFSRIIIQNKESMYKTAIVILKNEDDAYDALQEALIKMYSNISKLQNKEICVVDSLELTSPKTKEFNNTLNTLNLNGKTLIVTDGENGNVVLASRNMANLHVIEPSSINVLDLVGADNLLIDVASVNKIEEVLK